MYRRASMAWPLSVICACVRGRGWPEATRNCHSTRSRPEIISVTGCSTCRRVFISRKKKLLSCPATNSTVPALS